MIGYIVISYFVALIWLAVLVHKGELQRKSAFKWLLFSPVTLPVLVGASIARMLIL